LNDLFELATGLRWVDGIRICGRSFPVIHLPTGKMGANYVPFFAFTV